MNTSPQPETPATPLRQRPFAASQVLIAVICLVSAYWLMAFAIGREWLYVPSVALQVTVVWLSIRGLGRRQRSWPWIVLLVATGVVAVLTLIDMFFAALFSWGAKQAHRAGSQEAQRGTTWRERSQLMRETFDRLDGRSRSMGDVVAWVLLGTGLVWIGAIYYSVRKGLSEIIAGLSSIDERLARMESRHLER